MTLRDEIAAAAVRALTAGPYDMADALMPIVERAVRDVANRAFEAHGLSHHVRKMS